ncbi:MAG: M23 family metallopeptidase [Mycobacterium sp.]|uniref:M23 family metallopeptidase n=1 Tax=Mycobacterium sp. TaxID=1785 RepID=UPI002634D36F|nr:M23 family metallopeptidase [Mycobacterium sp.]MDI3314914.1 M23 family metallopeptidase [Mycobacterium sp.]
MIPFNEFGDLDDLDFSHNSVFTVEAQVLRAPELDDLHDTDDLTPLPLQPPGECDADRGLERGLDLDFDRGRDQDLDCRTEPYRYRLQERLTASGVIGAPWRGGQHRRQQLAGAVKSRVLITAMAAGAAAAAAHSATHHPGTTKAETVLAASTSTLGRTAASEYPRGMQMITVKSAANTAVHNEELAKGMAFAQERAQREARLRQPLFVMPTRGAFTSGFGYRWGVLHAGIDIANSIGTPIVAVSDGVVVDAGPTAGYGMWVKLRHADGTVTLYGHVNTTTVNVGQRVMAGDQIATMGNRGNSTGPHLHFEVLQGGTERIDPVPWLAARGLSLGNIAG